jgi:hypothetical protein
VSKVKGILDLLLGRGAPKFYPFEKKILEAVQSRLHTDASALFGRQIDSVNKVQRLAEGKEVDFYQMVDGRPTTDKSLHFPNMQQEERLATVNLTFDQKGSELKADVWLVDGRLFSIEFDQPPKRFLGGTGLDDAHQPMITEVAIWPESLKLR